MGYKESQSVGSAAVVHLSRTRSPSPANNPIAAASGRYFRFVTGGSLPARRRRRAFLKPVISARCCKFKLLCSRFAAFNVGAQRIKLFGPATPWPGSARCAPACALAPTAESDGGRSGTAYIYEAVRAAPRQFAKTPFLSPMVCLFGITLPFTEAVEGVLIFIGLWGPLIYRAELVLLIALTFGSTLRQRQYWTLPDGTLLPTPHCWHFGSTRVFLGRGERSGDAMKCQHDCRRTFTCADSRKRALLSRRPVLLTTVGQKR
jgi:hypothetical protein